MNYFGFRLLIRLQTACPRNRCRRASTLWVIKPTWGVHSRCWIHLGCNAAPESFHAFIIHNKTVRLRMETYFERWLHETNSLHSPTSQLFFPSSCCNWSCAWLLFNLLWDWGRRRVEPAGGVHCSCCIHLNSRTNCKTANRSNCMKKKTPEWLLMFRFS